MRAMAATTEVVMRAGASDVGACAGGGRGRTNGTSFDATRECARKFLAGDDPETRGERVITSGIFSTLNIYTDNRSIDLDVVLEPAATDHVPLSAAVRPALNLFEEYPTARGIDLSPILAFTVLNVFQGTAAALPCSTTKLIGARQRKSGRGFAGRRETFNALIPPR